MQTTSETGFAPVRTPPRIHSEVDVTPASDSEYSRNETKEKTDLLTKSPSATQIARKDVDVTLKSTKDSVNPKNVPTTKSKPTIMNMSPKKEPEKESKESIEVDATLASFSEKPRKQMRSPLIGKQETKLERQVTENEEITEGNSLSETYRKEFSWKQLQKTPTPD